MMQGRLGLVLRQMRTRWIWILLAVIMMLPKATFAERQGSIDVPESIPEMPRIDLQPNLISPVPLNGAWAMPDHRPLGVHLDNYDLTVAQIDAARDTGCGLARLAIPMEHFLEDTEPDWAVLDQVVSKLTRAGFEVLPVLTAKAAVPEFYVPFCEAVATRYGQTFEYYQLLDNINYKIGLGTQDYTDLVAKSRAAIVLADRDAVIVSGGVRGADLTYLDMLDSQGAMRSLDVIALNLYPPKNAIETTAATGSGLDAHSLPYVASVVDWATSKGKKVWVTSLGVSTCYSWVGVDQGQQAAAYTRSALYLGWLGVERIIFAEIQDSDPSFTRPSECCGLLDVTGTPKASYYALRALNSVISGAYHIEPDFIYQGSTFQRPDAADLLLAAELLDVPGADAMSEFQVHWLSVFAFWFYAPETEQYMMIYWLGDDPAYPTLISLQLSHIGLTPSERFMLLDNASSPIDYSYAKNMLYIPYIPASTIPGVVRFEVNNHGRSG